MDAWCALNCLQKGDQTLSLYIQTHTHIHKNPHTHTDTGQHESSSKHALSRLFFISVRMSIQRRPSSIDITALKLRLHYLRQMHLYECVPINTFYASSSYSYIYIHRCRPNRSILCTIWQSNISHFGVFVCVQ